MECALASNADQFTIDGRAYVAAFGTVSSARTARNRQNPAVRQARVGIHQQYDDLRIRHPGWFTRRIVDVTTSRYFSSPAH